MASKGLHGRSVGHPTVAEAPRMTATTVIAVKLAAAAQDTDADAGAVDALKSLATDRGLLKVMVSPTDTLEQALHEARELAVHAAAEQADPIAEPPAE
jgi:hypothetical protein